MHVLPNDIKNILILQWGALGDIVASTPAIHAVRENYPKARIALLTNQLMQQIIPPGFLVDEHITVHTERRYVRDSIFEQLKMVWNLRRKKFDIAVNLRNSSERAAFIIYLSGAKVRIGNGPKHLMGLYTIPLPHPEGRYHEIHRNLDIIKGLGCTVTDENPVVYISAQAQDAAELFFKDHGLIKAATLCIHPGASKPTRAWLPERYAEIGKRFVKKFNAKILLTWGKGEEELVHTVAAEIGENAVIASTPTIGDLAASIQRCALFISNCTGPMNVAVAARTPVIALLGSSDPVDWGAYGTIHVNIKSPLILDRYSDEEERQAFDAITVERVWEAVNRRWSELTKR